MEVEDVQRLEDAVKDELDWGYIQRFASQHRVFPLIYKNLIQYCSDQVPEHVLHDLKILCLKNFVRTNSQLANLLAVGTLLTESGISYLAFKGPVFTADVYGDIALRSYCDLDLLVSRRDLRRAIFFLIKADFKTDINLNQDQYEKLVNKTHHAVLVRDSTAVEVHWELSGRYFSGAVDIAKVSGRAVCIALDGRSIMTLGSEDLLVYLCIHGCRHYWLQLDSVCCVHELIRRKQELDWNLVFDIAKEQGANKMLVLGLLLAIQIFQVKLPVEVVEWLGKFPGLQEVACYFAKHLFASSNSVPMLSGYKEQVRYNYTIMDKKLDWLRYSMRPLFNTTHSDWEWMKIPAVLSPAYYVLRPLRLIIKYAGKWFN